MKSEKYDPQEAELEFPCLMQNGLGTVFLINRDQVGIVIFSGGNSHLQIGDEIGKLSEESIDEFRRFTGTITLRSDE